MSQDESARCGDGQTDDAHQREKTAIITRFAAAPSTGTTVGDAEANCDWYTLVSKEIAVKTVFRAR